MQNLKSIISTQLDLKVLADMDGVGAGQNEDAEMIDMSSPYQRGDFIVGLTNGIYPGEVLNIVGDQVTADFLIPANIRQSTKKLDTGRDRLQSKTKYMRSTKTLFFRYALC